MSKMDSSSDFLDSGPSCSWMSDRQTNDYCDDANISGGDEDPSDDNLYLSDVESVVSEDDVDTSIPTARSCRVIGKKCIQHLNTLEKRIVGRLEILRKQLKQVRYEIDNSTNASTNEPKICNWFTIFGIPYFKDNTYFTCSPNEDTLIKRANKELILIDLPQTRLWKETQRRLLKAAVHEEETARQVSQLKTKMSSIRKKLEEETASSIRDDLNKSLEELELRIAVVKSKTLKEIIGFSDSEYDWMKISAQVLTGDFTPEECRSMWRSYLHPKLSKAKWSKEEENKLVQLAKLYRYEDWDRLAEELGTNRSGYQCICHFQGKLNHSDSPHKWSTKEDNRLRTLIAKLRVGSYIPWTKIASYMEGHTRTQVYTRWAYSLDPNIKRGRFTEKEDILLVAAIRRYGTDNFQKVTRFLPGRTVTQTRERYNTLLKEPFQWNAEEDKKLLTLVEKHGKGNWTAITKYFPTNTRTQLRTRYVTIQNRLKKAQSGSKISVSSQPRKHDSNKIDKTWNKLQDILIDVKTPEDLNEENMIELRNRLCGKKRKKRPGRKKGQTKVINDFDEQITSIFRCVYQQIGGRKKARFDEEEKRKKTESMTLILQHFQAQLNIPEDDSEVGLEKCFFNELDKIVLGKIRDEKLLEKCSKDCPVHNTNHEAPGSSHAVVPSSATGSATSFSEVTTSSSEVSTLSNEVPTSSSKVSTASSSEVPASFSKVSTASSSEVATSSSEVPTSSSKVPTGSSSEVPTSSSKVPTSSSSEVPISSSEVLTSSSKVPTASSSEVLTSSSDVPTAFSSEVPSNSSISTDINYFLPPSYSSLVGFRTLLLTRKNLLEVGEEESEFDGNEPPNSPSSGCLSVEDAHSLWHNRFFSLFFYPAVMSRSFCKNNTSLDDTDDSDTVPVVENSENTRESKAKRYKFTGHKKRKPSNKKKEEKSSPSVQKRKYEKSGKYKKSSVQLPETEWRRSARHKHASSTSTTQNEESIPTRPQKKESQQSVLTEADSDSGQQSFTPSLRADDDDESPASCTQQ